MKKCVVFGIAALLCFSASSQIQVSSYVNAPHYNDHYGYSSGEISISVGNADTNVYWNYYTIEPYLNNYAEFNIDTAGTIDSLHQFSFGADLVLKQKEERLQTLYRLNSSCQGDSLFEIGSYGSKYKDFQTYNKALLKLHYPFQYLDEFRDSVVKNFGLSSSTVHRYVKADAWGNISIPFIGTFECIRVVTRDTILTKGCGALGCNNPVTEFVTTYEWYSNQEIQRIMVYKTTETKGEAILKHEVMVLHNKVLSVENIDSKSHFTVFPNPCANELHFAPFNGRIKIIDMQGKQCVDLTSFGQSTIDTGNLSNGLYLISFFAEDGTYLGSEKFSK